MRVLIYSPFSLWPQHAYFERLMAKKLEAEKAKTLFITCDSFLNWCEIRRPCGECTGKGHHMDKEIGINATPISSFLKGPKISNFPFNDHEPVIFKGYDLKQAIKSTFFTRFRVLKFEIKTFEQKQVYKDMIISSINFINAMENAIDEFKPTHILNFSGRFFTQNLLYAIAKKKNITIINHELGQIKDTYQFKINKSLHEFHDVLEQWNTIKDNPISEIDLIDTVKVLNGWRKAKNRAGAIFIDPSKDTISDKEIKDKASRYAKTLLVLTSSDDEIAALDGFEEIFDSQIEWLEKIIEFLTNNPSIYGIIRFHPNTINTDGKIETMVEYIEKLLSTKLPNNIEIIPPQKKINTYKLFEISDCSTTYGTTAGIEFLTTGRPTLISRKCIYYYLTFFNRVENKSDFFKDLNSLLTKKLSNSDILQAIKFFRLYNITISHKFNLIKLIGSYTPWLNFLTQHQILADKDLNNFYETTFLNKNIEPQSSNSSNETVLENYKLKNVSTAKHVLLISKKTESDFFKEKDKDFQHYKKLILYYGHYPDVIFPNDKHFQREWYKKAGGFSGLFSEVFSIFQRSIFTFPHMHRKTKILKFLLNIFYKIRYNESAVLKCQIETIKPDFILNFNYENTILNDDLRIKQFKMKY